MADKAVRSLLLIYWGWKSLLEKLTSKKLFVLKQQISPVKGAPVGFI